MGLLSAIGGALGLFADSQNAKAINKATQVAQDTADKNIALYRDIFDTTRNDLAPGRALYGPAATALAQRFGLQTADSPAGDAQTSPLSAPASGGAPGGLQPWDAGYVAPTSVDTRTGGQFDAQAYLQANPDVLANAQQRVANGTASSLEQVAQEHYNLYGQPEGRAEPMTPVSVTPASTDAAGRPLAPDLPTYIRPTGPSAPDLASYFTNFQADPGYQFRQSEALKGVNAQSAVRGKLRSGDAAAALATRASDLASQEYNNWFQRQLQRAQLDQGAYQFGANRSDTNFLNDRSYGTNLALTNRDRADNLFSQDRGYNADRYDQGTSNLFGLLSAGQGAATGTASAGNVFSQAAANQNTAAGNARANGILAKNQFGQNLFGSALQGAGAIFGGF